MAKMSKRFLPPTIREENLRSVIKKVYDDMNGLAESVAKPEDEKAPRTKGQGGDIRIIEDKATNRIVLQGYSSKGWVNLVSVSPDEFDQQ